MLFVNCSFTLSLQVDCKRIRVELKLWRVIYRRTSRYHARLHWSPTVWEFPLCGMNLFCYQMGFSRCFCWIAVNVCGGQTKHWVSSLFIRSFCMLLWMTQALHDCMKMLTAACVLWMNHMNKTSDSLTSDLSLSLSRGRAADSLITRFINNSTNWFHAA